MRMQDDTLAALPPIKRLNHRGLLSVDMSSAWYFIPICAAEHYDYGRTVSMKPMPQPPWRKDKRIWREKMT